MDLHLEGKVVLVAGSSRGIGLATARAFLAEGCLTVITGRDSTALAQARASLGSEFGPERVMACEGDLRDSGVIRTVLAAVGDRWGPPDCLVANVGSWSGTERLGPRGVGLAATPRGELLRHAFASCSRFSLR